MITFANPSALYLLLSVPFIVGLYVLSRMARKSKLKRFGNLNIIRNLIPQSSRYMPNVKIVIELLAMTFIILAIARPILPLSTPGEGDKEMTSGIEIMICVDVSNSMRASSTSDEQGISRMQRAKFILEKLVDKLQNDKVGLIVFAGDAYMQLPITSDYISAKMFLNNLNPGAVPTQGTAIGAAIEMATNSFSPESEFQKAILLITDVENFEDDALQATKQAKDAGIQVDVIGLGTDTPVRIPADDSRSSYMIDNDGTEAKSALNEELGEKIAKAGNGIYVSGNASDAVSQIADQLSDLSKKEFTRITSSNPSDELFPLCAVIALLLLAIDTLLPYSKINWLTKYNFFSRK